MTLTVKELDLSTLKGKEKTAYKRLVEQKFRGYLSGEDPLHIEGSELICIGAAEDNIPIGLAIGTYHPQPLSAEMYCLTVQQDSQLPLVGNSLLEQLEQCLKAKGAIEVKTTYLTNEIETPNFERLLSERQWHKGSLVMVRCHFNTKTFTTPWLHLPLSLPTGSEIFLWKDLKKQEREYLEHIAAQGGVPDYVSPFVKEDLIDWNSSLGLRTSEGVIGWIVNWAPKKNLVVFRSLFVFPEYYLQGHGIKLLSESIRLVQKKPTRHATLEVPMAYADNRWIKFVKHRLLPYAESVDRFFSSWKML